jgi:hypothetical protein
VQSHSNKDPADNVVCFELRTPEGLQTLTGHGPAVAEDCVEGIWRAISAAGFEAAAVARVYSEWEPSDADKRFVRESFHSVPLTYSFSRPDTDAGWPAALLVAQRALNEALDSPQSISPKAQPKPWWRFWTRA